MNEHSLNELGDALSTLRTDIAIAIPWSTLHRWFGATRLESPHYAQINHQWTQTWHQAGEKHLPPNVHLFHGVNKLTLVRETTLEDPPAVDLQILGHPS